MGTAAKFEVPKFNNEYELREAVDGAGQEFAKARRDLLIGINSKSVCPFDVNIGE